MGPYKFSSIPAPLQAVRPRGRFSFSLQSLWKTRVFPRFSTHGFCRAAFVENSCAKNSRGERRFCPKRETPQKINFRPRLSFQKRLCDLFSPQIFPLFPFWNTSCITQSSIFCGKLGGKSGKHCGKPYFFFTKSVENPVEKVKKSFQMGYSSDTRPKMESRTSHGFS